MQSDTSSIPSHDNDFAVKRVGLDDPWQWLAKGWRDLWRAPGLSLGYGLVVALVSLALTAALFSLHLASLVLVLGAGFLLLGPLLAVGLYEKSRRLEAGEPLVARDIILVSTHSPVQLAFMGVALCLAFLAWVRIATLLFALFFGLQPFPPLDQFLPTLLFSWHGLTLLAVGTFTGGLLALGVFMISAISVPLLMAEKRDVLSAIIISIKAVLENFTAMVLWAWMIALLTVFGLVTGYLGLIVTFPLIGHATWHAYRALRPS